MYTFFLKKKKSCEPRVTAQWKQVARRNALTYTYTISDCPYAILLFTTDSNLLTSIKP